ncbi:MAG: MarR family transcriptional regulator [Acidimicrobiia bacterium]|nr:MarR family transcriptional regulator [Acidimicrobiia bacterium]
MAPTTSMTSTQLAAWRNLLRAHAEVVDRLSTELAETHDLPISWYEVLLYLREAPDGRLRMHELADSLLVSRSAATRFIDRMEDAGLVTRQVCPSDRRGMDVVLTAEGRRIFSEAAPTHLAGIERHFAAHVDEDEARVLADVLERIAEAVRADNGDG